MAEDKKFLNYEHNYILYKSKTAMCIGITYFNKGFQSNPVMAFQFAPVNPSTEGGDNDNKTFNWNETKSFWFTSYDKIYEFFAKLNRWKNVIAYLKKEKIQDPDQIKNRFKEMADKQKVSNPKKKTTVYMMPKFYNGLYYLSVTYSGEITVTLTEEEIEGLLAYIDGFIKNYHLLTLFHRLMNSVVRGTGKLSSDEGSGDFDNKPSGNTRSPNTSKPSSNSKPANNAPPFDPEGAGGFDSELDDVMGALDGFDDAI